MFPDHILIQRNLLLISFSLSGIYKAGLRGWVGVQWPAASNWSILKEFYDYLHCQSRSYFLPNSFLVSAQCLA